MKKRKVFELEKKLLGFLLDLDYDEELVKNSFLFIFLLFQINILFKPKLMSMSFRYVITSFSITSLAAFNFSVQQVLDNFFGSMTSYHNLLQC